MLSDGLSPAAQTRKTHCVKSKPDTRVKGAPPRCSSGSSGARASGAMGTAAAGGGAPPPGPRERGKIVAERAAQDIHAHFVLASEHEHEAEGKPLYPLGSRSRAPPPERDERSVEEQFNIDNMKRLKVRDWGGWGGAAGEARAPHARAPRRQVCWSSAAFCALRGGKRPQWRPRGATTKEAWGEGRAQMARGAQVREGRGPRLRTVRAVHTELVACPTVTPRRCRPHS